MKKIVLAAVGAVLVAGFAVDGASAAQRTHHRSAVQAPVVRSDEGFRNSYNAYGPGYGAWSYDSRAEGGAISAPAGR